MLTNKRILVIGLARSGKAAIRLLEACNASITVNVSDQKDNIEGYDEYLSKGIEIICGGHPSELFERDFDFVIKNPGIKYNLPFIKRLKERNIPIYTEIELAYRMAKPQKYLALTGTNGKTTTVHLLEQVCSKAFDNVHLAGNVGFALCDIVMDYNLLEESDHTIILEMSNFQLLDIDQFKPSVSSILNMTPDHLDYMETLDEYYISKTNIYMNQQDGYFITNLDDSTVLNYLTKYPLNCNQITFGYNNGDCCVKGDSIYYNNEQIINLEEIKVVGKHNVYNIMSVICIAKAINISTEILYNAIKEFKGVEHRIEYVNTVNGCKVYNDSKATNVEATIIALQSFHQPTILLLGGFDKGLDISPILDYCKDVKHIITFGVAGPRFKESLLIDNCTCASNLKEAYELAIKISCKDDVILLSPSTSSFDEFKSYVDRGLKFKEYVNKK